MIQYVEALQKSQRIPKNTPLIYTTAWTQRGRDGVVDQVSTEPTTGAGEGGSDR